jgi:hypothetical protein
MEKRFQIKRCGLVTVRPPSHQVFGGFNAPYQVLW